jgi:hypothetical protein
VRLVELLSALGWSVVIHRDALGGLRAVTSRGRERVEADAPRFEELAPLVYARVFSVYARVFFVRARVRRRCKEELRGERPPCRDP